MIVESTAFITSDDSVFIDEIEAQHHELELAEKCVAKFLATHITLGDKLKAFLDNAGYLRDVLDAYLIELEVLKAMQKKREMAASAAMEE